MITISRQKYFRMRFWLGFCTSFLKNVDRFNWKNSIDSIDIEKALSVAEQINIKVA